MSISFLINVTNSVDGSTPLPVAGILSTQDPVTGIWTVTNNLGVDVQDLGLIDLAILVQSISVPVLPQADDWILARAWAVDSNVGGAVFFNVANQNGDPITPILTLPTGTNGYGTDQLPVYTGELVQVDQAAPQGPVAIGLVVIPVEAKDAVCCTDRATAGGGAPPPP